MGKHNKFKNKFSYLWAESKMWLSGFIIVPALYAFITDYVAFDYLERVAHESGLAITSVQLIAYAVSAIAGIYAYNLMLSTQYPSFLFNTEQELAKPSLKDVVRYTRTTKRPIFGKKQ